MSIHFPTLFRHFDETATRVTGRPLTDDEKAVAHTEIVDTFQKAKRERIPYSAAFEKFYPTMEAKNAFPEVYEILRRKRGHIEELLDGKREFPERAEKILSTFSPSPLLGLKEALGVREAIT